VTIDTLARWAELLDSKFRIPGTNIRFGLDPILSLIPGIGDLASPIFAGVLIVRGFGQRIPKVVMARMLLNAAIDALIGLIPVAGNVGDIFWRANTLNLALLQRHAQPGRRATASDYFFVFGILGLLAAVVIVPILLGIWLITTIGAIANSQ
jgi:hypothetical protein